MNLGLLLGNILVCTLVAGRADELPITPQESSRGASQGGSYRTGLVQIADLVRRHNPRLRAARYLLAEANGRFKQSGRWQNPKLITDYTTDPYSRELQGSVGFNQAFPLAGRLRWEKSVSAAEVAAVEVEIRDVERRLIAEAKTLAVQILTIEAQKALRGRQLRLAEDLSVFIRKLVGRGESSDLDTGLAKLTETQLELEVHHLDHEAKRLKGKLKTLLGMEPGIDLQLHDGLPQPKIERDQPVQLANRPDYQAAVQRALAAKREIGLAKAGRWQDVNVGVFARRIREVDQPIGLENEERIGVQVSLPLPLWQRNRGLIAEKTAAASRWEQTLVAMENEIRNEVIASREVMNTLAVHAEEVRDELLPVAKKHVERVTVAYKDGLVDLQSVLEARSQAVELESKYLIAIEDYHLARIRFESAQGYSKGKE